MKEEGEEENYTMFRGFNISKFSSFVDSLYKFILKNSVSCMVCEKQSNEIIMVASFALPSKFTYILMVFQINL